jgi:hypothetical protein
MPSDRAPLANPGTPPPAASPPDPKSAALAAWLGQFSRTLKTCRLYDARNPNTIRFRDELGTQLDAMLEAHGAFRLEFSAHQVACEGRIVLAAREREENFAMPFYRDGLRTLTFNPGVETAELDLLVDLVLRVTARSAGSGDDLVTLLWDANLPHVDMSYISSQTETDLADDGDDLLTGAAPGTPGVDLMPWPGSAGGGGGGGGGTAGAGEAGSANASPDGEAPDHALVQRSEDWLAGEPAHELLACFDALDATSAEDVDRFMTHMLDERVSRTAPATLALVRETLRAGLLPGDHEDLEDLLVRVLHESIAAAEWNDARDAVDALTECTEGQWDALSLVETLAHPDSPVTGSLVAYLDGHALADVHAFVEFARTLGPAAIEWLMGIVAIANHQRTRRTLVRALADLCGGNPERLAPWLTDPRWYVVRNAVLVVGSVEGGANAGLFRHLLRYPDARVRHEVVAALNRCDADDARPLLLALLDDPEPSIRGSALHQLGARRNREASEALLELVLAPDFRKRPAEEVRSVTAALAGCAGDEVLPHLEEQLYAPGWFGKNAGPYCQAIARCIARIGSPAAMGILEHGAKSRMPATRDACRLVLKGTGHA